MTTKMRVWIASVALVVSVALIYVSELAYATGDADLPATVVKIGEMIKSKDNDGAKKLAGATAKKVEDVDAIMHMFKTRAKKGTGVGLVPGPNPAKDGIEIALRDIARNGPANPAKEAAALETSGYWIAAIADLTEAKAPAKDQGKKTKKAWKDWSNDLRAAGLEFAKASAAKGGQEMKTAAAKVNAVCNNCHSVFKE